MTSTQQQAPAPALPIGQAVGQAEATLTKLLGMALADRSISRRVYLALQRLNALGDQATRTVYEQDLTEWLELGPAAAAGLADELIQAGLAAASGGDGGIRLTSQGQALRADILADGRRLTGPVLATIDPADLQTTIRTLTEITTGLRGIAVRPAAKEATA